MGNYFMDKIYICMRKKIWKKNEKQPNHYLNEKKYSTML